MAMHTQSDALKVLIVGDSNVYWLWRFASAALPTQFGVATEFGVDGHNCNVHCLGTRGATLDSLSSPAGRQRIASEAADVIVLHIGGNDIDCVRGDPPQAVGMRMFMFAQYLVKMGAKQVVISQIVRRARWRHSTTEDGAAKVTCINEFLLAACDPPGPISFWQHRRLWQSNRTIFRADGVHFSDFGNHRFMRSIRGAILTAVNSVNASH